MKIPANNIIEDKNLPNKSILDWALGQDLDETLNVHDPTI